MATTAEYGLGEYAFPRGWFMVAVAEEVTTKPQPVRFFGKEMVLYRGKSGRVVLLDAYCPHMRVHLARNTTSYIVKDGEQMEGDSIRCPGHGWRFNADGQCDDIPYSTTGTVPKAACVKSHKVVEKAGCIWMWHDMEGGAPDFDLPAFAEWDLEEQGWVRWRLDHLGTLPIHPQEILDNMADLAHFIPVHGSRDIVYFENEFDGHIIRQRFGAGHRTLVQTDADVLVNDTWYTGPGILLSTMEGQHPSVIMICNTPVDDGVVRVWYALMVKIGSARADDAGVSMARSYQDVALDAFAQDFELWQHKEPALTILQVPDDGPFHKERIWYRQFYNPRDRAKEFQDRVNGIHTSVDKRKAADKAA
ncbi:Rieske 2Fe-2S domain-containing protein [Novosphingobium sp.]|uniref:Rieske 2Fe-2S domain-containing protein n=1 Tax=Novosphingobium sp. TaxID=1874826 RepID=UPI0025ED39E8|nr:Rieske 2Fe-2S domain-containing protein [Novosphingobium sp.]MCC6924706.1 Rieske (2Fe-2S) protein [Novosphingobium sp.]